MFFGKDINVQELGKLFSAMTLEDNVIQRQKYRGCQSVHLAH